MMIFRRHEPLESTSIMTNPLRTTFKSLATLAVAFLAAPGADAQVSPPFSGTIFIDPDIILPSDPSAFTGLEYTGQGSRTMFDRRVNNWITVNAFLFDAGFDDGLTAEVQVNPEFQNADSAEVHAERYARVIGQLPTTLRRDVETVWIHKGVNPFGGGNNNLLIHTGQGALYEADGILAETFVHEASHTSLDADHAASAGWLAAQQNDPTFISTYARDNPNREDVAESFLPYLAVRYRSDRISTDLQNTIASTIPNRIAYFDGLDLDMYPLVPRATGIAGDRPEEVPGDLRIISSYPNPFAGRTTIEYLLNVPARVQVAVYDITGQTVTELADAFEPAGNHRLIFTPAGLPAGVYVCRITAVGAVATRRVVYVR